MLNLREYRRTADRLADHLPWAALVGDGAVLNKDGSFQRTIAFRGPDLESSTEAELVSTCARVNNVLRRFGSGWALFIEAHRRTVQTYPESRFPDAGSWLVDAERRASFLAADAQFESRYFLTFCWMPPADAADGAGRRLLSRPEERMTASREAFRDTVRLQSEIVASVREDARTLGEIAARSDAAEGSLQAAQATNQLLFLAAKQALQMQQMTAAQYRSDSLERARKDQAAAEARAATQRFLGDGNAYTPR